MKISKDSFMQPEVHKCHFRLVETTIGTEVIPDFVESGDNLDQYCEGQIQEIGEWQPGFVGRMSAPGYMDCTPWIYGESESAVTAELEEYYGDAEDWEGEEGEA